MLVVKNLKDLIALSGNEIGHSNWTRVGQHMIDDFAKATDDHQWIHVDIERAAREMPEGKTIAHGYLILSLIPKLNNEVIRFENTRMALNYGTDKVRFTYPVQSGSNIRLQLKVNKVEVVRDGAKVFFSNTVEIEGKDKPACIAETIALVYFS